MNRTKPLIALVAAVAIGASACNAQPAEQSTTTAPPLASTTTVGASTTTTAAATTTTVAPIETVGVTGIPADLAFAVEQLLSAIQDPRNETPNVDEALVEHHTGVIGDLPASYVASATVQELDTGGSVAIVELETGDFAALADEGDGWYVVGAQLASLGFTPWLGDDPRRVLVLGSDARPGGDAAVHRMDSIHILTSVADEASGAILGYPRDSYVSTPYGEMRINALTSSSRGPEALFSQFTEEWNIPLEGYILTGFAGFEDLVAATIGRLTITLPRSIPTQEWFAGFPSGEQTLNPTRTLDFSRTRKLIPGGDFTRSWHQGLVMKATLTMLQDRPVSDLPVLIGELAKYTETNLTATDLIQLGAAAMLMDISQISNDVLPGHLGRGAGGASVVFLEPEADDIVADVIDDGLLNKSNT
ncbi:MAG: LCP family protein [Acidimicrobiia bacterium]